MSCISLRLPPARKVWKSFTCTIGKLGKINKSKAFKKPRKHLNTTTTTTTKPSKFFSRRFRRKKLSAFYGYGLHKKPAPVYIDKLFKEPTCDIVKHLKPQIAEIRGIRQNRKPGEVAGTSKGGGESDRDKACTSDDMWESLALASPLMEGINERAEEFIARFRKEMVAQEIVARNF
ncbi:DUF761 domain protein [Senna tora]|uniref:DUF761 domain protein n=1 Tax=Senna tora TaxID=362788 RepID=A0A834SFB7_9FABA|nr:DUF761 domain protein [Senna tora]